MIHCIGGHSLIEVFPHQNAKTKQATYAMTLSCTLLSIDDSCARKDAHVVYKDAINAQKDNIKLELS